MRFNVQPGNPNTAADEADIAMTTSMTDVKNTGTLTDYTGNVIVKTTLRMTDKASGDTANTAATVQDFDFGAPVSCVATSDTDLGGACNQVTTLDTMVPGFAREGDRTIMSALSVWVEDAGPDPSIDPGGDDTCPPTCGSGDESTYLRQGLFTP